MSSEAVAYELDEKVAVLRLDDGKANALGAAVIEQLHASLSRAEKEAGSVLLVGRPGRFSAGFNLKEMGAPGGPGKLVGAGAELLMRMFMFPRPIVAACTGHALAAGALLLLSSDTRIGADVDAKIGLNEVAIGMGVPLFLVELAQHRLSRRHLTRSLTQAELYSPATAIDAGFLDQVVPESELLSTSLAEARRLAELPHPAHLIAKQRERGAIAERVLGGLSEDMKSIAGPSA